MTGQEFKKLFTQMVDEQDASEDKSESKCSCEDCSKCCAGCACKSESEDMD